MKPTLNTIDYDLTWPGAVASRDYLLNSIGDVDVIVTSPPYKSKEGFSERLMNRLALLARKSLRSGGMAFVNFGQLKEDFLRPSIVHKLIAEKLTPGQTIAWIKSIAIDGKQVGHYQPITSKKVLNYCWEPIYTFYKDKAPDLDRLSIGVPYSDKANLTRGTRGKNGDVHCAGDVWFIPYRTTGSKNKKRHSYEFPELLVERCLKLSGVKPGGTVLDPFCGSGTTAVVAKRLGLHCVLIDCVAKNLSAARVRWEDS